MSIFNNMLIHIVAVIYFRTLSSAEDVIGNPFEPEYIVSDGPTLPRCSSDIYDVERRFTSEIPMQVGNDPDKGKIEYVGVPCQLSDNCDPTLEFFPAERVWGKGFNSSVAKTVCEACVFSKGTMVDRVKFTKRGVTMCEKVCNNEDQKFLRVAPTCVNLKDSYCTKSHLRAAACVCLFKVIFQADKHYVFLHFIPNRDGNVAIKYVESGHPLRNPL